MSDKPLILQGNMTLNEKANHVVIRVAENSERTIDVSLKDGTIVRGLRINNPGCVKRTSDLWNGRSVDQTADDDLVVFKYPYWGIRATARVLLNYQRLYPGKYETIAKAIHRYSPPKGENNPDQTEAYVQRVAEAAGVDRNERLVWTDLTKVLDTMQKIVAEMICHECALEHDEVAKYFPPDFIGKAIEDAYDI